MKTSAYASEDLEETCQDIMSYLQGEGPIGLDEHSMAPMKKNAWNFLVWETELFRRTFHGLCNLAPISERECFLKCFNNEVGHWDLKTPRQLVMERCWWPTVYKDVSIYAKSCDGFQKACPGLRYRNALRLLVSNVFDVFSVDFAGPFPATSTWTPLVLVGVEHLTGWHIALATTGSTSQVVLKFVRNEIIYPFGPTRTIVSDNATCFTVSATASFMARHGIVWSTVLAYAPMSIGSAERVVGTWNNAIRKTALGTGMERENTHSSPIRISPTCPKRDRLALRFNVRGPTSDRFRCGERRKPTCFFVRPSTSFGTSGWICPASGSLRGLC